MTQLQQKTDTTLNAGVKISVESRILVVDDNKEIHNDFGKILLPSENRKIIDELDKLEALFNDTPHLPENKERVRSVVSAYQGEDAIEMIKASLVQGTPYSLAFIDVRMPPGIDGIETAKAILDLDPEIQIVICSAYSDYSWHEIAERLGHSDRFLILKKPFDSIEVRQISAVLHSRWTESRSDILTGALNRRAFGAHLIQQRLIASQTNKPLACVMVDLDHFKRVNDVHGHLVGDRVLVEASRCLNEQCNPASLICRYGGEEFCVLLPDHTEAQAFQWAEQAREALAQQEVVVNDMSISITGSFGAVSLGGDEISDNGIFLDAADQAMFAAKKRGRNRVVRFSQLEVFENEDPAALSSLDRVSASEIMRPVQSIRISDSIDVAIQTLIDAPNGVVPVTNETGSVAGLISQQDLLQSLSEKSLDKASIHSSMQTNVISFPSNTPASEINEFLNRFQIPQVLITDGPDPVGIIGRYAILEWILTNCVIEIEEA